jgi:hypothetical protein
MEKEQLQLRELFFADCYNQEEIADDGFIQTIELINQKFGLKISIILPYVQPKSLLS